jgi:hypothetical protein
MLSILFILTECSFPKIVAVSGMKKPQKLVFEKN